ncbi:MAG: hypothetical protein R3A10_02060 [Caldilineaceae bacterium]
MLGVPATPAGNEAANGAPPTARAPSASACWPWATATPGCPSSTPTGSTPRRPLMRPASRSPPGWTRVAAVTAVLGSAFPPNDATPLQAGQTVHLDKDKAARPDAPVVWVHQSDGHSKIGGTLTLPVLAGDRWIPLAEQGDVFDVWLQAESAVNLATGRGRCHRAGAAVHVGGVPACPGAGRACGPAAVDPDRLTQQLQERLDFRQSVVTDGGPVGPCAGRGRAPAESGGRSRRLRSAARLPSDRGRDGPGVCAAHRGRTRSGQP